MREISFQKYRKMFYEHKTGMDKKNGDYPGDSHHSFLESRKKPIDSEKK